MNVLMATDNDYRDTENTIIYDEIVQRYYIKTSTHASIYLFSINQIYFDKGSLDAETWKLNEMQQREESQDFGIGLTSSN